MLSPSTSQNCFTGSGGVGVKRGGSMYVELHRFGILTLYSHLFVHLLSSVHNKTKNAIFSPLDLSTYFDIIEC